MEHRLALVFYLDFDHDCSQPDKKIPKMFQDCATGRGSLSGIVVLQTVEWW